jgi:RecB family exonuclease
MEEVKEEEKTENFIEQSRSNNKNGGTYSFSRLWLYENCPEYYRLKYVDKKLPELPQKMAPFLGNLVHESLEWLYYQIKNRKINIDDLIEDFSDRWTNKYSKEIVIENGDSVKVKFNLGVKFLVDYYMKHRPFQENVVAIERKVLFPLDKDGKYQMQGYIDRLDLNHDGEYEIHDYKTGAYLKRQEDLDKDKQLAFYHLGLKEVFGKEVRAKLIWHFLAHNVNVTSQRTDEQLEKLKMETLQLIKKIESQQEWKSCGKVWCDWCGYKREHRVTYDDIIKFHKDLEKENIKKSNFDKGNLSLFG